VPFSREESVDLQLEGRRALVTGSSAGLGVGMARTLIQEGAAVVVHGRDRAKTERVARELGAAGVVVGDLSHDEGAETVHAAAVAALGGGLEILVNNAGGNRDSTSTMHPPLEISLAEWLDTYHANTLSAVRMILHAVPGMVAAGWGRVINISSAVAVQPNNLGSDYTGAKAAMNNLTVSLAGSLRSTGVTVNTVSPGVIGTDNMLAWGRDFYAADGGAEMSDQELSVRLATKFADLPVGRLGTLEDVGFVVCMLASPLAGFISGANYRVDGGQVRSVN
jgi:NAD(P)-dependent dehydrogenase (short-subunit alcohol dehydrogenase family)